jgi:hypothetical protein
MRPQHPLPTKLVIRGRIKGNEALDPLPFSPFSSAWAWRRVNSHHFGISVMVRAPHISGLIIPKFQILLKSPATQVGSQEWEKKCEARPLDRLNVAAPA